VDHFTYLCTGCSVQTANYWVEIREDGTVRKVGQVPPWDVRTPKVLSNSLEPEATELYRRAQVLLSQDVWAKPELWLNSRAQLGWSSESRNRRTTTARNQGPK